MFSNRIHRTAMIVIALCACGLSGCRSFDYRVADLPQEFQARKRYSANSLELARLSQVNVRNDVAQPGDVIGVQIATGIEDREPPTWNLRVTQAGAVEVPLVGEVQVGNLSLTEADRVIRQASMERGVYRNPKVSVAMKQQHTVKVTVMGAVKRPGVYELPSQGSDMVAALAAAGWMTDKADTMVEIRRPTTTSGIEQASYYEGGQPGSTTNVDLVQASQGMTMDLSLNDGATVMVRERPPESFSVVGLVRRPGQLTMPPDQDVRLLDAIAMAGGLTTEIVDSVRVIRLNTEGGPPVVIKASYDGAKSDPEYNIRLAPGDVVSIDETPMTYTLDAIRTFIRLSVPISTFL